MTRIDRIQIIGARHIEEVPDATVIANSWSARWRGRHRCLWHRVTLGRLIHSEESTVLRLGIDTGGTSTDLALVDDERGVDGQAGDGVA